MSYTNLLLRIVIITLLSTPIFTEKNIEEEDKGDSFEGFLENLIYFMVGQASEQGLEYIKSNGTMRKNRV